MAHLLVDSTHLCNGVHRRVLLNAPVNVRLSHRPAHRCQQSRCLHRRLRYIRAAAASTAEKSEATSLPQEVEWYALVANSQFMLHDVQNEAFAEQLRERRRLFQEQDKAMDFFLVSEPAWLDEHFPEQGKKVGRPCVALVSTDQTWITFMKLRLDRVLKLDLGRQAPEAVFRSNSPVPEYRPLDQDVKWTAPYPPYKPGWWNVFLAGS